MQSAPNKWLPERKPRYKFTKLFGTYMDVVSCDIPQGHDKLS